MKRNRKVKDSLFLYLFGNAEHKENALSHYNALNHSHYTDPDELEFNTLENVIYMGIKNDVSFILEDTLALFEQQSSYCPNMPLRGFIYAAKIYDEIAANSDVSIYDARLLRIPTPQYYVFYNGLSEQPERKTLRLSDAFIKPLPDSGYEWTATMLNINAGHNPELMRECRVLFDYSEFVAITRKNDTIYLDKDEAIRKTVQECLDRGILKNFLSKHRMEVYARMSILTDYDEKETMRKIADAHYKDGVKDGLEQGIAEGSLSMCLTLIRDGYLTVEVAAERLGKTEDEIRKLL